MPTSLRRDSKRTCANHSQRGREGVIKGEPSPAYARKKSALTSDQQRQLLNRAEQAVIDNPFHLIKRMVRSDGTMRDWNTPGVILGFDVEDNDTVRFHAFLFTMKA